MFEHYRVRKSSREPNSREVEALKEIASSKVVEIVEAVLRGSVEKRNEITDQVDGIYRMIDALEKGASPSKIPGLYHLCKEYEDQRDATGDSLRDLIRRIDSDLGNKKF